MGGFHLCLESSYTPDQYNISAETLLDLDVIQQGVLIQNIRITGCLNSNYTHQHII